MVFNDNRENGASESKIAFTFIDENLNIKSQLSYNYLQERIKLFEKKIPLSPSPILLLFEEVEAFIIAFLVCEKAGLVSVPMFYPRGKRHFERLEKLIENSGAEFILCDDKNKSKIKHGLTNHSIAVYSLSEIENSEAIYESKNISDITFIQYTSGSTSDPKGVIVSKENLIANHEMLKSTFHCDANSVILSWLPFYHDMGLIGSILHSLYVGAHCILMPSIAVIQSPFNWLLAITKFNVTHSGGPNFAYDLCIEKISQQQIQQLNLSTWHVAYNGSEPIKRLTIETFIQKFESCGFKSSSYYTCYGLAEATLLVSGGPYQSNTHVSSGRIANSMEVIIYQTQTSKSNTIKEGEILISGDSVCSGYFGKDNSNLFIEIENKRFLKTGDIGFLQNKQLMVTGRAKEIIIINGKNFFPYDIESEITHQLNEVEKNGVIVSSREINHIETPIVFVEIKKSNWLTINTLELYDKIDRLIIRTLGIETEDILVFSPRKLYRTSSGKLQRLKTKTDYSNNILDFSYSKKTINNRNNLKTDVWISSILNDHDLSKVKNYLIQLYYDKLKVELKTHNYNQNLIELGMDSLKSIDLVHTVNSDLGLNIEASRLMHISTTIEFEEYIKNLIWVKSTLSNGEEIIL